MEKYPFNSDYVDSYLNYFLLSRTRVAEDASAYKNCVYMNPISLTLTNCADRRERVNEFLSEKKEQIESLKSVVTGNCGKLLMEAFLLDKSLNNGRDGYSLDDKKNLFSRLLDKENQLAYCLERNQNASLI
jgi:hypothetical protein